MRNRENSLLRLTQQKEMKIGNENYHKNSHSDQPTTNQSERKKTTTKINA